MSVRRWILLVCVTVQLPLCIQGVVFGSDGNTLWSLQKPNCPLVPDASEFPHGKLVRNPIDAFIFAKLEEIGLEPAPQADKYTLVRRAYFDLLGLPPSPEQVADFVNNPSPNAWTQLVDELLNSSQYGERWGRHWLDVARYADSCGFETDSSYPNAWRYRDYVVQAFNDDKPYNIFVQEQIAGDELWPDNLDLNPKRVYEVTPAQKRHLQAWIATGLYCFGPKVAESALDARRLRYETLTDWADTTGSVFLGMTLGCARCHDHKFDPLTQKDYFAMQAIFSSSREVNVPLLTAMEFDNWHQDYPRLVAVHEARLALKLFQEEKNAGRQLTPEEQATEKTLRNTIVETVMNVPDEAASRPNTPFGPLMQVPMVTVLGHERSELVKPVYLLERGELSAASERIDPALPAALAEATGHAKRVRGPFGSRSELARWLTQADHPLTARVMINRVWQWHFGRGIVATPNDFGGMGTPPSNPELLDWLATEFIRRGWSVKEMHRVIMSSSTYQMTSRFGSNEHLQRDPDNRFHWRMDRRRLEAEALWDAVNSTAGTINLKMGGRPVAVPLSDSELSAIQYKWKWPVSVDPSEHTRRGIYILTLRNFQFPMFAVFDSPQTAVSCPSRDVTTVPTQALWNLNSPTVYQQAEHLAGRLVKDGGTDVDKWLDRLWMITLSRPIDASERREATDLLHTLSAEETDPNSDSTSGGTVQYTGSRAADLSSLPPAQARALVKLCLAIYNLNEFAFVD